MPGTVGENVPSLFRQEVASSSAPQGVPVQPPPPARWREAPNQVFPLHGWDTRGEGHKCAVHELGRVYDVTRDHSTALERQCEEAVRRVQALLPYVTAGALWCCHRRSCTRDSWRRAEPTGAISGHGS